MAPRNPIFLDHQAVAQAVASGDWLNRWCDLHEEDWAPMAKPGGEEFHLWPFMPPPAYEETIGLAIPEGSIWPASFGAADDWMLVATLPAPGGEARLTIGATTLNLKRDTAGLVATLGGPGVEAVGEPRMDVESDEAQITSRRWSGRSYLALNGRLLGSVGGPSERPEVEAISGEAIVIMAQSLGDDSQTLVFDALQTDDHRRVERERNAYRFSWGLRSLRIASLAMTAALMADVRDALEAGAIEPQPEMAHRIRELDDRFRTEQSALLHALLAWPRWRPGVGDHPANGVWDRNSFTNGSIAFAVACLSRLFPSVAMEQAVKAAVNRRASAFFAAETELAFSQAMRSRSSQWWVRRSANHGLIMMLTYATAMRLIGQADHPTARLVEGNALGALEKIIADGSFCEGVHYTAFALIHLAPFIALAGTGPHSPAAGVIALFPKLHDWWSMSMDGRGGVFANFGDNQSFTVAQRRASMTPFLRSFTTMSLADGMDDQAVDAFTPLVAGLPKRERAVRGPAVVLRRFPRNRYALAAGIGEDGRRNAGLFVIGSKPQATHNRNHDCAGFAFHSDGMDIVIADANRQPHWNNAVGLLGEDGRVVPFAGDRTYVGEVAASRPDDETVLIQAAFATDAAAGARPLKIERDFLFAPGSPVQLVVRTRVRGAKGLTPFLAFDVRVPDDGASSLTTCIADPSGGAGRRLPIVARKGLVCFDAPDAAERPVVFLTWVGRPDADPSSLISRLPDLD